jgi:hypothetical protein
MPEQGNIPISSPDILNDTGIPSREDASTELPIRALAIKFSKTQMQEQDGGLLIKGVPLLASGTWTDSAVGTPLFYPPETLREYASNWLDQSVWSRHLGGVPRDITDKVGDIREPRYENEAVTGDIFLHGGTQKSRDVIELVKRKLVSFVSVEHGGSERYNTATRQSEASSLVFSGIAVVNKGACKLCRINEAPVKKTEEKPVEEDSMADTKELEVKIEALTKELESVKAKPVPVVETPKELTEALGTIKALEARLKKVEDTPLPAATAAPTKELSAPAFSVKVNRKTGTIGGV